MKKKILFVPKERYDEVVKLIKSAGISYSSEYGLFHFDLISFIVGIIGGVLFGLLS